MKDNNSQECRNCHNFEYMDTTAQKSVAAKMHDQAVKDGQTCIDCHKGIAHKLPDMREVEPGFNRVIAWVCLKPESYFVSGMNEPYLVACHLR